MRAGRPLNSTSGRQPKGSSTGERRHNHPWQHDVHVVRRHRQGGAGFLDSLPTAGSSFTPNISARRIKALIFTIPMPRCLHLGAIAARHPHRLRHGSRQTNRFGVAEQARSAFLCLPDVVRFHPGYHFLPIMGQESAPPFVSDRYVRASCTYLPPDGLQVITLLVHHNFTTKPSTCQHQASRE